MKYLRKIYFIFYIFCFLFAPPFINNINLLILLGIYSIVILIFKYPKELISILKTKDFIKVFFLLLIYMFIYFISYAVSSIFFNYDITQNLILNFYSIFLSFFITFICSIYVVIKAKEYGYTTEELINCFIMAAVVQLIICLLCLYAPAFRAWTISKMIKENNSRFFTSQWLTERRFYGFSNNLLDLFGFGVGLLSCLSLFNSENSKKYLIISLLLLIICALNSRTGLIIFALGLIIFVFYKIVNKKIKIYQFIITSLIIIFSFILSYNIILKLSPNTIDWVKNDIISFVSKDDYNGTASIIYNKNFWILPEDYGLLFGKGFSVSAYSQFKVEGIAHSDCGYINEIWKAGFVGLIIYLCINFFILLKCVKYESNLNMKWYYIFCLFACLAFMVKGDLIGNNPGNVLIYTMFVHYLYKNKEVNSNEK